MMVSADAVAALGVGRLSMYYMELFKRLHAICLANG